MKYNWKGHKDRNRHKNRIRRSGQARLVYVRQTVTSPPREGEPSGTRERERESRRNRWHCTTALDLANSAQRHPSRGSKRKRPSFAPVSPKPPKGSRNQTDRFAARVERPKPWQTGGNSSFHWSVHAVEGRRESRMTPHLSSRLNGSQETLPGLPQVFHPDFFSGDDIFD